MGFKSRKTPKRSTRTSKKSAGSRSSRKPAKAAKSSRKPTKAAKSSRKAAKPAKAAKAGSGAKIIPLRETIRGAIVIALENTGSLRQAARALDMPYSSLRDKLDQLGIDAPGRPSRGR